MTTPGSSSGIDAADLAQARLPREETALGPATACCGALGGPFRQRAAARHRRVFHRLPPARRARREIAVVVTGIEPKHVPPVAIPVDFDDGPEVAVGAGLDGEPARCHVGRLEADVDHVERDRCGPGELNPVGAGAFGSGAPGIRRFLHSLANRSSKAVDDVRGRHAARRLCASVRWRRWLRPWGQIAWVVGFEIKNRSSFLEQLLLEGRHVVLVDSARRGVFLHAEGGSRAGGVAEDCAGKHHTRVRHAEVAGRDVAAGHQEVVDVLGIERAKGDGKGHALVMMIISVEMPARGAACERNPPSSDRRRSRPRRRRGPGKSVCSAMSFWVST